MRKWKVINRTQSVEHSMKVGAFRLEVWAPIGSDPASPVWSCRFSLVDDENPWTYTGKPQTLEEAQAQAFREVGTWLNRQQKAIDKAKS